MFRRLRPRFPDGREKNTKTYWRTQPFIYNSSFFVYLRHQKKADKNSRNRLNRIDLTRWSNIYLPGELNKGTKRRGPTKEGDQHENLTKPAPYDFRFYGGIAIVWVKGRVRLVTPARLRSFFLSLSTVGPAVSLGARSSAPSVSGGDEGKQKTTTTRGMRVLCPCLGRKPAAFKCVCSEGNNTYTSAPLTMIGWQTPPPPLIRMMRKMSEWKTWQQRQKVYIYLSMSIFFFLPLFYSEAKKKRRKSLCLLFSLYWNVQNHTHTHIREKSRLRCITIYNEQLRKLSWQNNPKQAEINPPPPLSLFCL